MSRSLTIRETFEITQRLSYIVKGNQVNIPEPITERAAAVRALASGGGSNVVAGGGCVRGPLWVMAT